MSLTVATAGKGGTGKTTVAALTVRYLLERGVRPVLAVDADADAGLNELLGLPLPRGLGAVREGMRRVKGMSKEAYVEAGLAQAVEEGQGFDLLAMGRPEGPGCYCAANSLLSRHLARLAGNYPAVVIDNEAGLEHISRLVTRRLDLMLVVSDASRRGLRAAARIRELVAEVGLEVGRARLIVNRAAGPLPAALAAEASAVGLGEPHLIPADAAITQAEVQGTPLFALPADGPAYEALTRLLAAELARLGA